MQKKAAQILILSASLANRYAFNSLESKLKEPDNKLLQKDIAKQVF